MLKLQVIIGSTRPGRNGEAVGKWVYEIAKKRQDIEVELVDLAEVNLPLLDEPVPPSQHKYSKQHTLDWSARVASADAYLIVTAEYNHGIPAALKNAIDFLYSEWNNKVVGFVSYGSNGGSRAVEQLRQVAAEIQMADVREQVLLSLANDFENYSVFKPTERHEAQLGKVLDQVVRWGEAFKAMRESQV